MIFLCLEPSHVIAFCAFVKHGKSIGLPCAKTWFNYEEWVEQGLNFWPPGYSALVPSRVNSSKSEVEGVNHHM